MDGDGFVPGRLAAEQGYVVAGAAEAFGEEIDEGLVGGGIHRWGGEADFEFGAVFAGDSVGGGARLDFEGELDAPGDFPDERHGGLLQGLDGNAAEMDFTAFGLESDGAWGDVDAVDFIDLAAVEVDEVGIAAGFDLEVVPIAGGALGVFEFLDAVDVACELMFGDMEGAGLAGGDAETLESEDIAGVAVHELDLDGAGEGA
jgi:hypothetical protein